MVADFIRLITCKLASWETINIGEGKDSTIACKLVGGLVIVKQGEHRHFK